MDWWLVLLGLVVGVGLGVCLWRIVEPRLDVMLSPLMDGAILVAQSNHSIGSSGNVDGDVALIELNKKYESPHDDGEIALAAKDLIEGAITPNSQLEMGNSDVESAVLSSSDGAEQSDVTMGMLDSLFDGDLVNKAVILLQYLQILSIFLTPGFYLSLPLTWLKSFSWVAYINLDVNILSVGVDLDWVSFICALCYQPLILLWWVCVDSGYIEARMSENIEWFTMRWVTSNDRICEAFECLDIDISNLDEMESLRGFSFIFFVIPLMILFVITIPLEIAFGNVGVAAVVFIACLYCMANVFIWVRGLARNSLKRSYSIRFPNDRDDEHFHRDAKLLEMNFIIFCYFAAYITPLLSFLGHIRNRDERPVLTILSCVVLPIYSFGPPFLLARVSSALLKHLPSKNYRDERKYKLVLDQMINTSAMEWNRVRVSSPEGVAVVRNPSIIGKDLEPTGRVLEYGEIVAFSREMEEEDDDGDITYTFYELVDGSGWVADRYPGKHGKSDEVVSVVLRVDSTYTVTNLHGHIVYPAPTNILEEDFSSEDKSATRKLKYGEKVNIAFTEKRGKVRWFKLENQNGWINNRNHVASVTIKENNKVVIRGSLIPVYSTPLDNSENFFAGVKEPPLTGKYVGPSGTARSLTVETSEVRTINNISSPGVGLGSKAKNKSVKTFYKLSDGSGWICDMHLAPHQTAPDARKATGCGRAALLSIIAPYERSVWFVKPLLMAEKFAAAIIVIGVGSSSSSTRSLGTWFAFAFTFSTALAFISLAPFISRGEDKMDRGQRTSITFFTLLAALFQDRVFGSQTKQIGTVLLFINSVVSCVFLVLSLNPVGIYTKIDFSLRQGRALAKYSTLDDHSIKRLLFMSKFNIDFPSSAQRVSDRKNWMSSLDEMAVSCLTDSQIVFIVLYAGDICLSNRFIRTRLTTSETMAFDVMASAAAGKHLSVMEHLVNVMPEFNVNKAVRGKWYADRSPLMLAAGAGFLEGCRFIAKHNKGGSSKLSQFVSSMNALHYSLLYIDTDVTDGSNLPDIFEFLLSKEVGIDVKVKTVDDGYTILHLLCQNDDLHNLHLKRNPNMTVDMVDALVLKLTKLVVERGCSVLEMDKNSETNCLHILCREFGSKKGQLASEGQFMQLEFLLETCKTNQKKEEDESTEDSFDENNPLSIKNEDGQTMLHLACELDCSQKNMPRRSCLAPKLIELGADVHQEDTDEHTPIWNVVENSNNIELVRLFLSIDADFAKIPGLLNAAAIPSVSSSDGTTPILSALLDTAGKENIDITNDEEETALHTAIHFSNPASVQTLLEYGASLSAKDGNGMTAVDLAVRDLKDRPTDAETRAIFKMISDADKERQSLLEKGDESKGLKI